MGPGLADATGKRLEQEGRGEGGDGTMGREEDADPIATLIIGGAGRVGRSEHILGDHRRGIDPHDEERRPGEELDQRQLLHHRRHGREIADHMAEQIVGPPLRMEAARDDAGDAIGGEEPAQQIQLLFQRPAPDGGDDGKAGDDPERTTGGDRRRRLLAGRFAGLGKAGHLLGRIFAGGEHGPEHGEEQRGAADIEADPHRVGDHAGGRDIGDAHLVEQPGGGGADHRAGADEGGLDRIAGHMLFLRQHVADKGAERLHRDVERGVENPEHQRGGHQARRIGHAEKRKRREQRTGEEIGPAPAEAAPGAVAIMADHRLHQQAGQRRGDPQQGEIVEIFPQRLEDARHVGVLQREADLDAEEAEADIPQPPEALARPTVGRRRARFQPHLTHSGHPHPSP